MGVDASGSTRVVRINKQLAASGTRLNSRTLP